MLTKIMKDTKDLFLQKNIDSVDEQDLMSFVKKSRSVNQNRFNTDWYNLQNNIEQRQIIHNLKKYKNI